MMNSLSFPRKVTVFVQPPGSERRIHVDGFATGRTVSEVFSYIHHLFKLLKRSRSNGRSKGSGDDKWIVDPFQCDAAACEGGARGSANGKRNHIGCFTLSPEEVMRLTIQEVLQLYPETFGVHHGTGVFIMAAGSGEVPLSAFPLSPSTYGGGVKQNQGDEALFLDVSVRPVVEKDSLGHLNVEHSDSPVLFGFIETEEGTYESAHLLEVYVEVE